MQAHLGNDDIHWRDGNAFLRSEAPNSPAEAHKRLDRPEGAGDGKAGTAFQAFPVIVGQNGAGGK